MHCSEKCFDRCVLLDSGRFEFKIASHQMIEEQNIQDGELIYLITLECKLHLV